MSKPTVNPKTVKVALRVAGIMLAIAVSLVTAWESGAITDGAEFIQALAAAAVGALNEQP